MKRLDELDLKHKQDAEFTGEKYKPFFKPKEKELRWHHFKHLEPREMLEHVQKNVFPFVKSLTDRDGPFIEYMGNAVFIITKPALLVEAVNIIDEIFEEIEHEQH